MTVFDTSRSSIIVYFRAGPHPRAQPSLTLRILLGARSRFQLHACRGAPPHDLSLRDLSSPCPPERNAQRRVDFACHNNPLSSEALSGSAQAPPRPCRPPSALLRLWDASRRLGSSQAGRRLPRADKGSAERETLARVRDTAPGA